MKLISVLARNAILAGIGGGLLAIAGYLLMWALWYAIAPHPYYLYVVNARGLQEALFMFLLVPAATAIFVLAACANEIRSAIDAWLSSVLSGMVTGATVFIAAIAGLFGLFFGIVPGPFPYNSELFCGGTIYDWMIHEPLTLFRPGPYGPGYTPLQTVLSALFDIAVTAIRFMLVPAVVTAIFALAIFYLWPQLRRIFADPEKRNREKVMIMLALGLVIFALMVLPPMAFVCL